MSGRSANVDLAQWLIARGVHEEATRRISENASPCEEVSVGKPPEAAIICTEAEVVQRGDDNQAVYRVLARRRMRVVRSKRPVVVLDVVETVSQLDKEIADQDDILNLEVSLAADGLSMTVQDRSSDFDVHSGGRRRRVSCDQARTATGSSANDPIGRRWDRFDRELVSRACLARGLWVWTAGRFVRTRGGS